MNPKSFVVNENTINFNFSINNEKINIQTFPEIQTLKVINHLKLSDQGCNEWKDALGYEVENLIWQLPVQRISKGLKPS